MLIFSTILRNQNVNWMDVRELSYTDSIILHNNSQNHLLD